MADVKETELPGLGVRYEFETEDDQRVSVVVHRTGRKEISLATREDPDRFSRVLDLSQEDAHTLTEVLGASPVTESLERLQQQIEGLAIDWLPVRADSPYVERTIGDTQIRTRTGVSIVAVLRDDVATAAPAPDFVLETGDHLVVVGTPRGIEATVGLLHDG